ncbi:MAG: hypothetical protein ACOX5X_01870 [Acholeplasmataceae bacterium]|jgi:hypothetical protein
MENRENKQKFKEAKIKFAVAIGYFNHASVFLNVIITTLITVLAGMATIGLTNTLYPLIVGNYVHMIFMLLFFAIFELVLRYTLYVFSFKTILRTKGVLLLPYNLISIFILVFFLEIQFTSFFAIFIFVILFSIIRSGVNYIFYSIQRYFSKEVEL